MDAIETANRLRRLADELDPLPEPDPEPVLVRVRLTRDGVGIEQRIIPMPCVGDGLWNAFCHDGELIYDAGAPLRNEKWGLVVERVSG